MVVISIIHSKERKEKPEIFKFPARWHFFLFTLSWILGILMKYLCINCIFWELTIPVGVNLSVTASPCHLPYRGEALAFREASPLPGKLFSSPEAPLQGATATTAASGGNREELLGQRPAGCKRQRSRRWVPQPGFGEELATRLRGWTKDSLSVSRSRDGEVILEFETRGIKR